jgi:hypothetical protein
MPPKGHWRESVRLEPAWTETVAIDSDLLTSRNAFYWNECCSFARAPAKIASATISCLRELKRSRARDAIGLQNLLHLAERGRVDLRHTAFVNSENSANFLHGHLLVVIEGDDRLIAFR